MSAGEVIGSELLRGWECYPSNLHALFPQTNLDHYQHRIKDDATRLFNPSSTDIRFVTVRSTSAPQGSTEAAELYSITDHVTNEAQVEEILIVCISHLNHC